MKAERKAQLIMAAVLAALGGVTLYMTLAIFLDLPGVRERHAPYVPDVVAANHVAAYLYLGACLGLLLKKRWAKRLLGIAVVVLVIAGALLAIHILAGGEYRNATILALSFRTALTLTCYLVARWALRPPPEPSAETSAG